MSAPDSVIALMNRFEEHYDSYRQPAYNETQVRREFVDPFFAALGWDVNNEQGHAEAYKEVIHEASLKVGEATKAPDYSFRIGPVRKFFVETKKPSVNIAENNRPAFQLRRYGWSAKLSLCVLTDFEEFAVYDTRVRPSKDDAASTARVLYLRYDQYDDRWEDIAGIFSRDAILKGAFDKFAESKTRKRGTAEVDEAFLNEIEEWRTLLARQIALRNKQLSQREVNTAVQKTIDRIIFLRICEDRGIEKYGRLQGLLNGSSVYKRLGQFFEQADDRYNSGLFHFHKERDRDEEPDEWTLGLQIDDKPLKQILKHLYYPDSPYEFSVLGADILGQVYEQFLGKVIVLTPAHHAKIEEKPEVKKAGGVYYTPTYIVDYIVEQTVGQLVADRPPHEVAGRTKKTFKPARGKHPLSVLDPACGSGSFLIGAYQFLLDWYLEQYVSAGPEKFPDRVYPVRDELWRLTTAERKRILLDHIYGVDIDAQAVEVTKLSLLLKVLEGENKESLDRQLTMFRERALPDLSQNIKCGNSLIGPDFYDGRQLEMFDEEELYRINAFDWNAEFAEIMGRGGFDAVIGNPPYVRMESFKPLKDYFREKYECHEERSDLYAYFVERAHRIVRPEGRFGMIVSNKFILANYGAPLRQCISDLATVDRIVDFAGLPVFRGATVRTIVLLTTPGGRSRRTQYTPPLDSETFLSVEAGTVDLDEVIEPTTYQLRPKATRSRDWELLKAASADLLEKLKSLGQPLVDVMEGRICMGIKSGLTSAFVIDRSDRDAIVAENPEAEEILHPFVQGRSIRRYHIRDDEKWLIYTPHDIDMSPYPAVLNHLKPFRKKLENRATRQEWYELQQPQFAYFDFLTAPKIIFPDIATHCRFALDTESRFGANTMYFLPTDSYELLALLNSRLANFIFRQVCAALEGPGESYLRFFGQYLEPFPVVGDASGQLAGLGELNTSLSEQLQVARTPAEKDVLTRRITATNRQIDHLVYDLYGLTDEEIRIVEEATT